MVDPDWPRFAQGIKDSDKRWAEGAKPINVIIYVLFLIKKDIKMKNLYSKDKLRRLRNDIPIATVIGDILAIPSKISEGYFRFLCPKCKEFNTAINPKTNLSRCFKCEINYNAIDIVMAVKNYNFKEAVKFLDTLRKI